MATSSSRRNVWLVDFTARYLWKFLRVFLAGHLSRRCGNCVLSESFTEIDEHGICRYCREYRDRKSVSAEPVRGQNAPELDQVFRSTEERGIGRYDALVLVSGGKDSAYLLDRLARDFPKLRIVTLLVDNGFMSPIALENAARLTDRFNFDHITFHPKKSLVKKALHFGLTHLEKQSGYSIVDLLDGFLIFDTARNLAARIDTPLVVSGVSRVQAENIFGLTEFDLTAKDQHAALTKHAGISLGEVFDEDELEYFWDESRWPADRTPRFIMPFVVWDPSEESIVGELDRRGLLDAKRTSPLLTNHALIPVIGLAEVAKFGYSCFEVEFAKMVRLGKSDRNYWLNLFEMLEYSAKTGRHIDHTVTDTLRALDLAPKDIGVRS